MQTFRTQDIQVFKHDPREQLFTDLPSKTSKSLEVSKQTIYTEPKFHINKLIKRLYAHILHILPHACFLQNSLTACVDGANLTLSPTLLLPNHLKPRKVTKLFPNTRCKSCRPLDTAAVIRNQHYSLQKQQQSFALED